MLLRCAEPPGSVASCRVASCRSGGLEEPWRHSQISAVANEGQPILIAIPVNANQVAKVYLFRSQQIRQRIYDVPLDGPFQVPCAISLIRAFLKQEFLAWSGYPKQELAFGRFQHPLLHLAQFDIQDLL